MEPKVVFPATKTTTKSPEMRGGRSNSHQTTHQTRSVSFTTSDTRGELVLPFTFCQLSSILNLLITSRAKVTLCDPVLTVPQRPEALFPAWPPKNF